MGVWGERGGSRKEEKCQCMANCIEGTLEAAKQSETQAQRTAIVIVKSCGNTAAAVQNTCDLYVTTNRDVQRM